MLLLDSSLLFLLAMLCKELPYPCGLASILPARPQRPAQSRTCQDGGLWEVWGSLSWEVIRNSFILKAPWPYREGSDQVCLPASEGITNPAIILKQEMIKSILYLTSSKWPDLLLSCRSWPDSDYQCFIPQDHLMMNSRALWPNVAFSKSYLTRGSKGYVQQQLDLS